MEVWSMSKLFSSIVFETERYSSALLPTDQKFDQSYFTEWSLDTWHPRSNHLPDSGVIAQRFLGLYRTLVTAPGDWLQIARIVEHGPISFVRFIVIQVKIFRVLFT